MVHILPHIENIIMFGEHSLSNNATVDTKFLKTMITKNIIKLRIITLQTNILQHRLRHTENLFYGDSH